MANEIALIPTDIEWELISKQATLYVKSGLLPKSVNTAEKAITIAIKGRELGIAPLTAYSHIHVIDGKPTMSAELMLAQIYRNIPGAIVNYVVTNPKVCTIEAARPGHKPSSFSYTIEEADKAQLLHKHNWKTFPAAMLRARCVSAMARAIFPDAIQGVSYTPEELGAEVDIAGNVISVEPSKDKAEAMTAQLEAPIINVLPSPAIVTPTINADVPLDPHDPNFDQDPGNYVVRVGKSFIGKKLSEIGRNPVGAWLDSLKSMYAKEGKAPEPIWAETIARMEAYLAQDS